MKHRLSNAERLEIEDAIRVRRTLTDKMLARRYCLSISAIGAIGCRMRRREGATPHTPTRARMAHADANG